MKAPLARSRQKPNLRREIVTAARAMFAEEGFEAVTMRKLAARIEYSPTTPWDEALAATVDWYRDRAAAPGALRTTH